MDIAWLEASIAEMANVQWSFSAKALASLLGVRGFKEVVRKPQRVSYTRPSGDRLDVYLNEDVVLSIEWTIDAYLTPDILSEDEYEDKVDEYYRKYEAALVAGRRQLGPPDFADGAAAQGFPGDQDAVWLALWNRDAFRFMIQQRHEDKELPFRLCLVVAPP